MKSKRTKAERETAKRMLENLRAGRDVRGRKVRKIRAAIKVRRYENEMKLAVALEKLPLQSGSISLTGEGVRVRGERGN